MAQEGSISEDTLFDIPAAMSSQYLIPYSPSSSPTLYDIPVKLSGDFSVTHADIVLVRNVIESAIAELDAEFARLSSSSTTSTSLPVTALCTPHIGAIEATDAGIRYIASRVQADVVVLDPSELAKGPSGVYGPKLSSALWDLYSSHYHAKEGDLPVLGSNAGISPTAQETLPPVATQDPASAASSSKSKDKAQSSSDSDSSDGSDEDNSDSQSPIKAKNFPPPSHELCRAMQAVRAIVHAGLGDSVTRRIIYLRDFGAFSKVFLPWTQALMSVLSAKPPTIIVAGIVTAQMTGPGAESGEKDHSSAKHRRFLDHASGRRECEDFLNRKYSAQWRQSIDKSTRFESLGDVFNSAFIHRYRGKGLRDSMFSVTPVYACPALVFQRVIRACLATPVPPLVRDLSLQEKGQRFLGANLHGFLTGLRAEGKSIESSDCEIRAMQDALAVQFRASLCSRILLQPEYEDVVSGLPQCTTVENLIRAYNADRDWRMQVAGERNGMGVTATADAIVMQVRTDPSLNDKERDLLSCIVDPKTIQTTFKDVCIQPNVIESLRTTVSLPLFYPSAFSKGILATESSGGVLLYGPPGTGKTMACRALAKECGARMLQITASTIQRCFVGETEQIITAVFSLARRLGPCVLFIDELDALFGARRGASEGRTPVWHTSALTEFMQEMDGLRTADLNRAKGLIVIGATNRPQDLDHAVLRRLPRRILIDLPGFQERLKILQHYMKDEEKDESVDMNWLAKQTRMFSGSDLRHLVLSAAHIALKESVKFSWASDQINPTHMELGPRIITSDHFKQARKEISASSMANEQVLDGLRRWGKGERKVQGDPSM